MKDMHPQAGTSWKSTEAIVTGPGKPILCYGQWSLEGLSLGEAWEAMFMLSGAISWAGKQAQLSTNLISLGEGSHLITQAITKGQIKPRGLGCPHSIPPVSTPFNFSNQDQSLWSPSLPTAAEGWEVHRHGPWPMYQEWGWAPQWGWDQGQGQWELWAAPPLMPLP